MFGKSIITGVCLVTLLAVTGGPVLAYAPDAPLANAAMRGDLEAVRSLLAAGQADVNVAQGDGTTALHWAAYQDDAEMARLLVDAGAQIGPKTRLGDITPLFMAAKNGSAEMIGLLLDAGADARSTNANGTTPLMLAAAAGSEASLSVLLDRGAEVNAQDTTNGQTAVMFASSLGRTAAVRFLAERGADLDVNTNVSEIIKREYRYRLRQDPNRSQQTRVEGASNLPVMGGMTALLFATREGHAEVVHELVAAGADVNVVNAADAMSPLVSAIINGGFDIAMFLVEQGADPNLATMRGWTPLYAAVDSQWAARTWYPAPSVSEEEVHYLDLMAALIESGADLDARLGTKLWFRTFHGDWIKQDGATAFWRAAKSNDIAAMRLLLAAGANPAIRSLAGGSPLQAAAGFGLEPQTSNVVPDARLDAVRYLVEKIGADPNGADKQGYTVLHGAALTANHEVIAYLVAAGADVKARAAVVFGGIGETDRDVDQETGDTVADMANGPKPHNLQYPETVAFLESLGAVNSDHCRAATCVVKTLAEKPQQ
jgi:ankyrin repeat protein